MSHANLWAPWRQMYLQGLTQKVDVASEARTGAGSSPPAADFLAQYWREPGRDQEHLVVHRNAHGLVLLNRYPYANGHLMAALGEGRSRLLEYEPAQRAEFWRLTEIAVELVQAALQPQGINVGINEGEAAGAGLPGHLHAHIIPRWQGDTNFITVVGQVRVIPGALEEMWAAYRQVHAQLFPSPQR